MEQQSIKRRKRYLQIIFKSPRLHAPIKVAAEAETTITRMRIPPTVIEITILIIM